MATVSFAPGREFAHLGFLYEALKSPGGLGFGPRDADNFRRSQNLINSSAQFVGGVTSALNSLFESVRRLREAAAVLVTANGSGVFNRAEGFSSDPDMVKLQVKDGADDSKFQIALTQTAQTQQNAGSKLTGYQTTSIVPGINLFTITDVKSSQTVSFEVSKIAGNRTALLEIKAKINDANLNVKADVAIDGNSFRLILKATVSGSDGAFTVADAAGNAVRATAMDTVVLSARDASFAIDGLMLTSAANSFELQEGKVKVDLIAATSKVVNIEVRRDGDAVVEAMKNLATAFNEVLAQLANGTLAQAARAKDALSGQIRKSRQELESIGVVQDQAGHLSVRADGFRRALADDPAKVESLIGGADGMATKLAGELERIRTGPLARLQALSALTTITPSLAAAFATAGFALDLTV